MFLLCALAAAAQEKPAVTRNDLPPSSILTEEVASFERIRSDLASWSEVELTAFKEMTARAKADCSRIERTPHEGEEALALARLCAVGWDWDGTYSAARWYTRASAPPEQATHLAVGFALLVKADLNLQATARALDDLREMQERVPFGEDTESVFEYAISVLDVMRPEDSVHATMIRQNALLDVVAGKSASMSVGKAEAEAWHTLALLHFADHPDAEEAQRTLLLNAIASRSAPLPTAERYVAERGRAVYEWLGREAPQLHVLRSGTLQSSPRHAKGKPSATLWVVEMANAADAPALSLAVDSLRTRLNKEQYATLVLLEAPSSNAPKRSSPLHADYTRELLLHEFQQDSGPLFVLLDEAERVRWCGVGTAAWLNPQQQAEVLLSHAVTHENSAE
jgi:hypothetical protein